MKNIFKKNRTGIQKVGHLYGSFYHFCSDLSRDRRKRVGKFLDKHEGLVGGFITTVIVAPVALGIVGSIATSIEAKKLDAEDNTAEKKPVVDIEISHES